MTSTDELRLYTLSETAERLHVTEDWLLKRVRERRLPARRSGRYWTFSAADIRDAIDAMAVPATRGSSPYPAKVSREGAES
ncbi:MULTISPECIES: helix-turn-helix domain-containing protein [Nocardia]|jgi:excisionase family DNA binding protein|uniref:helix-turn-helix domain-containing protein n=1 Tax=Nocardia TaxID=1817 RepID=UPI0024556D34|nr:MULTISPECIES: helix-turn-helix domain-containing protein [Nocardia]